jgi:rhamnose transport system permease protein
VSDTPRTARPHATLLQRLMRWESALVVLLIGTIVLGDQLSPAFLQSGNFFYIGLNIGEVAIIALPLALIVITGEIDLSVASMLGLSGTILADLTSRGLDIWLSMAITLALGVLMGLFNGLLVTKVGLPSLAVTIGTLTLYRGIAQIVLPNSSLGGFPDYLTNIGVVPIPGTQIPWSIAIFAVLAVAFAVTLHATPVGRAIFAIGANQEAAYFSGIRVKRIKLCLFVLSGFFCAVAGILFSLRFASARYDAGTGLELNAVLIVLLGGISIFGGRGTMLGLILAVCVIAALQSGLTLHLMSPQDQNVVIGGLLIASVVLPNLSSFYERARPRLASAGARRASRRITPSGGPS